MTIYDAALESNRRVAWALYHRARDELEDVFLWAAELGAYLEELVPDLPPDARELIGIVFEPIPDLDRTSVRRYVRRRLEARP